MTDKRAVFLAMRWFKEAGREKDRKMRFSDRLASELISASNNEVSSDGVSSGELV